MAITVLGQQLKEQHQELCSLLDQSISLVSKCNDPEHENILKDRLSHIQSAALFVVVGEVNAGKSSFVNALLQETVCEVSPDPCTAVIQELAYGETAETTRISDVCEKRFLPKEILKEITIVDTPGTNSLIRAHQTITERYLPQSDLALFVFNSKNPHTATAWDLLNSLNGEWKRKVVFILQQSDIASQHELSINTQRVMQYARERGIQNPVIFTVSALREIEGSRDSGFAEFRHFLQEAVKKGDVWKIKFDGTRKTISNVAGKIQTRLNTELTSIREERQLIEKLEKEVSSYQEKTAMLKKMATDHLCSAYDRLARKLEGDFTEGLSLSSILQRTIPFLTSKSIKEWLSDLSTEFQQTSAQEIDMESKRIVKDVVGTISPMLSYLKEALSSRKNTYQAHETVLPDPDTLLASLARQLQNLRTSHAVLAKGEQGINLHSLTRTGGGLAAFGAMLAGIPHFLILDITGGLFALTGASLVTGALIFKRTRIITDFSHHIERSKAEFRSRIDQEMSMIFEKLFLDIHQHIKDPLHSLAGQESRFTALLQETESLRSRLARL